MELSKLINTRASQSFGNKGLVSSLGIWDLLPGVSSWDRGSTRQALWRSTLHVSSLLLVLPVLCSVGFSHPSGLLKASPHHDWHLKARRLT